MTSGPKAKYGREYLIWKNWGGAQSFGHLDRAYAAYYLAEIRNTGLGQINRVLEIGFGNGGFLTFCKSQSWGVCGTEENSGLIEAAKLAGFEATPANQLSVAPSETFDLVAAFDVIEHIEQQSLPLLFDEIRRLLRPGGVFLARFPNGDSPFGLSLQHGDVTHVTTIGSGKIEFFAKNSGFQIVSMGGAASPILCGSITLAARRAVIAPLRAVLDFVFKKIFFNGQKISFFSPSLVVCLRKPDVGNKNAPL
jgi:SAM-dependent methyltransferase